MKKIYCIEEWLKENESIYDGSFWGCIETPWKLGCFDFIQEFDDEEKFKEELLNIINVGGIIGKVFIKEENEDYNTANKLCGISN